MAARKKADGSPPAPVVRVAPLGELKVYMVTEEKLDALGRGSPGAVFLNFALALLPLAGAFLITLLTTTIEAVTSLVFFVCACLISLVVGLLCLVLAWQNHASARALVEKIKNRMPPPPAIPQEASGPPTASEPAADPPPPG